jgi:hypothetical protein
MLVEVSVDWAKEVTHLRAGRGILREIDPRN